MSLDTVQPHVFCGPEFVLEVPASALGQVLLRPSPAACSSTPGARWQIAPSALLTFQTELLYLCGPVTRRRIHRSESFPLAAGGQALVYPGDAFYHVLGTALPAPPAVVRYLTVHTPGGMTAGEEAALAQSVAVHRRQREAGRGGTGGPTSAQTHPTPANDDAAHYCLLHLTDSRLAAEVYWICLRTHALALSHGCRVFLYLSSAALLRAPSVSPAELLARREALRRRHNLDADLWEALQVGLKTSAAVQAIKRGPTTGDPAGQAGRLAFVHALLAYCEAHVTYASVLDANEDASPFLLAMGLFLEGGLTLGDLATHFLRHPRRVVRALALFLTRYLLPPEEWGPFFYLALGDDVAIVAGPPLDLPAEPVPLREVARRLLLDTEVGEAWLPALHAFWLDTVVRPALGTMQALREAPPQPPPHPTGGPPTPAPAAARAFGGREGALKGTGRGVAALGFRSVREIYRFARAKRARTLVPQRMATLVARTRRRGDVVVPDDDDPDALDDDAEDFLIDVDVAAPAIEEARPTTAASGPADLGAGGDPAAVGLRRTAVARSSGTAASIDRRTPAAHLSNTAVETSDPHTRILKEGYRTVISLLGRTTPFNADERYLQF